VQVKFQDRTLTHTLTIMYSKVKADLTKKSIAVDTLFSVHAQMLHACLYTMLLTHVQAVSSGSNTFVRTDHAHGWWNKKGEENKMKSCSNGKGKEFQKRTMCIHPSFCTTTTYSIFLVRICSLFVECIRVHPFISLQKTKLCCWPVHSSNVASKEKERIKKRP
jgi:hypothetical protein